MVDRRGEPARPFFVFLNYDDAHTPYKPPDGAETRFARMPESRDEIRIIYELWSKTRQVDVAAALHRFGWRLLRNCLAYLDERLGELFDDLQRRGVLDRTLVVITSDHGEGLGEHDLYEHGFSLFSTELRVPLLILAPAGVPVGGVVRDTASLRDLPATIVDLIGLGTGAPFPGGSLARLWRDPPAGSDQGVSDIAISELASPNPLYFKVMPSPVAAAR